MTSEIRTNTIKNRVGLGTVSYTNTGIVVSGIVTATGGLDISGDIDVDGHTNLDNVSVAGVSTFTGITNFDNGAINIINGGGAYNTHLNYNDTGINYVTSTNGGATYFRGSNNSVTAMAVQGSGPVDIDGDLRHLGDTDTMLQFGTDFIRLKTAGNTRFSINSTGKVLLDNSDGTFTIGGDNVYDNAKINLMVGSLSQTSATTEATALVIHDQNSRRNGTEGSGSWKSKITFRSTQINGNNQSEGASIVHDITYNNYSSTKMRSDLVFKTRGDAQTSTSDAATEKLRIKHDGQVILTGANTGNHMSGFGSNVGGLTIDDVGNQHTALEVSHGSNKAFLVASSNNSVYLSSYGTNNFSLEHTGGSGTRERLRIDSSGKIIVREANTNPVNDFEVRRANGGGDVAIRIGNNTGTNAGSTASLYFTTSPTQNFNTAYIQAVRDGGRLNFGYSTNDPTVTMQISTNKVGITNTSPECRSGGIDMSSNDGTSGKTFTDMRGYSNLIIRNPNTDQHGFTQLLFENGGGTSAATMFRHRLGPSHGSQQNFVGDLCLFRRTGNAGGSNNDFRESTRFCGATEQARQIWWASGNTDTSGTSRLGWHHLSASRDHPGTDAYTFFRLETGAAAYARNGMGKYTCVWTTGHASGYGIAIGHFGYYMPHGSSTIVVNEHIIHRERYSNGSYYAWSDSPNLRIINNTASGGTNAAISFRCGGRRSSGFDLGVVVGLFIDLYVPESANGDSNPRLYVAGDSESNLSGGGHGNPVSHAYMSIQSSNPNHSSQP